MLWQAQIALTPEYRDAQAPGTGAESAFLSAFIGAAERIDSVQSAWRGADTLPTTPWDPPTRNVVVDFSFDGDEPAAAAHAFDVIYHSAFDEAVMTARDARPSTIGAMVQVRARAPGDRAPQH